MCFGRVEVMDGSSLSRIVQPFPSSLAMKKCGTTASADFYKHDPGHPGRPAFRASPTHGYALQISPNKSRELSLRKYAIYPGVCRKRFRLPRQAHLRISLGLNNVSVRYLAALAADGGLSAGQFGGVAGDWVAGFVVD